LTVVAGFKVLQCGDPSGSGRGGPGYTIPDENPQGLKESAQGRTVIYPRGTVAMANTGQPHSGGSQFFVVWGDSTLPPSYAVFGTVDAASLAVLDKIAAAGVNPTNGPQDGAPKSPVTIQTAVVGV
jgi:cyclophilin family peptidyl-prolyl cis-trans isomerase